VRIVRAEPERREALWRNVHALRTGLEALGFSLGATQSQILPLLLQEPRRTMAAARLLLRHGVFVQGIRPPTVPPGTARLRIAPMAPHTQEDLQEALRAFAYLKKLLSKPERLAAAPLSAEPAPIRR
jgi:7-keto-8-aminopelargonate synthetase-like enzyme